METNLDKLNHFLSAVDGMKEAAIGCDDVFVHLDAYVEAVLAGQDAKALFPQVEEHLAHCKACAEEFELLRLAVSTLA